MSFLSKFRDRQRVKAMADGLDVEDRNRYPVELDTRAVQPVWDLSKGSAIPNAGRGQLVVNAAADYSVALLDEIIQDIVGNGTNNPLPEGLYRIDAIEAVLYATTDAAWQGMAQKLISFVLAYHDFLGDGGDNDRVIYQARPMWKCYKSVASPRMRSVRWSLAGSGSMYVPSDDDADPVDVRLHAHPACTWNRIVDARMPISASGSAGGLRMVISNMDGAAFGADMRFTWSVYARRSDNGIPPDP